MHRFKSPTGIMMLTDLQELFVNAVDAWVR